MARLLSLLGPELAALTRTTIALTELRAAPANNVLPTTATAGLNVRIAVGETRDDVLARALLEHAAVAMAEATSGFAAPSPSISAAQSRISTMPA